jgi:uncharacterized protein (TIGR04255 family)
VNSATPALSTQTSRVSSQSWGRACCQGGGTTVANLPEFDNPPVAEVVLGVQFRQLFGMRGLALTPLRERWRVDYPKIEEQPALAPIVEGEPPNIPRLQFSVVPLPPTRQLFLSESGNQLTQVQPDRLIINWRTGDPPTKYPRYGYMRNAFTNRFRDLAEFATNENLGDIEVTQAELSYINVIEIPQDEVGNVGRFLKGWSGTVGHHLGEPEEARITLTFQVPGIGQPPVRLYVEVSPAQRSNGELVIFFTLTVRGNPGGRGLEETLKFMDEAHEHIVRSFAELTGESMHGIWELRHDNS